jgi:predicted nucleic acid-binding protein
MKAVLVHPSGWMACADGSDPAHVACCAARDAALEAGQILVTTDFVVDETLTLIRRRLGVDAAAAWWRQVDGSQRLRWERIDAARFERARQLFFQHRDKTFSFTDCTTFAVMRELKLVQALGTDAHFTQAGFHVLPGATRRPIPPSRRQPRRRS